MSRHRRTSLSGTCERLVKAAPAEQSAATGVETLDDGELAAWTEFDVDAKVWEAHELRCKAMGVPGGFSYVATSTFASRGQPPYGLVIAADAAHFGQEALAQAMHDSLPEDFSVKLSDLFQFSIIPEPRVLIEVGLALLTTTSNDLITTHLGQLVGRLTGFLARSGEQRPLTLEVRTHRTPRTRTSEVKIQVNDTDQWVKALMAAPEILRAEGQFVTWDEESKDWRQVDPPPSR
jgi:hypothetical protein